jgi:hypothetical protein
VRGSAHRFPTASAKKATPAPLPVEASASADVLRIPYACDTVQSTLPDDDDAATVAARTA